MLPLDFLKAWEAISRKEMYSVVQCLVTNDSQQSFPFLPAHGLVPVPYKHTPSSILDSPGEEGKLLQLPLTKEKFISFLSEFCHVSMTELVCQTMFS